MLFECLSLMSSSLLSPSPSTPSVSTVLASCYDRLLNDPHSQAATHLIHFFLIPASSVFPLGLLILHHRLHRLTTILHRDPTLFSPLPILLHNVLHLLRPRSQPLRDKRDKLAPTGRSSSLLDERCEAALLRGTQDDGFRARVRLGGSDWFCGGGLGLLRRRRFGRIIFVGGRRWLCCESASASSLSMLIVITNIPSRRPHQSRRHGRPPVWQASASPPSRWQADGSQHFGCRNDATHPLPLTRRDARIARLPLIFLPDLLGPLGQDDRLLVDLVRGLDLALLLLLLLHLLAPLFVLFRSLCLR